MARRNNVLVILGLAFFVLGAAIVFLLVEDDEGSSTSASAGGGPTSVLVARDGITAGTSGADAVQQELVEAKRVDADEIAPGALTTTASLTGQVFASDVAAGTQLTATALRPAQVRSRFISIPDGLEAVAVQVPFVPGVAGYVGAGDRVNVYAVNGPEIQQIVSGVEVLDVSIEVAPRVANPDQETPRPGGSNITYLLALDQAQTQTIVGTQTAQPLYLSLTESSQGG